jgi:hypothetical protein
MAMTPAEAMTTSNRSVFSRILAAALLTLSRDFMSTGMKVRLEASGAEAMRDSAAEWERPVKKMCLGLCGRRWVIDEEPTPAVPGVCKCGSAGV